jgi:hypothetical protein
MFQTRRVVVDPAPTTPSQCNLRLKGRAYLGKMRTLRTQARPRTAKTIALSICFVRLVRVSVTSLAANAHKPFPPPPPSTHTPKQASSRNHHTMEDCLEPTKGFSLAVAVRTIIDAAPPRSSSSSSSRISSRISSPSSVVTSTVAVPDHGRSRSGTILYSDDDDDTPFPNDNSQPKQQQPSLLFPDSVPQSTASSSLSSSSLPLPWYRAGGMQVNLNGMAINTTMTLIVLLRHDVSSSRVHGDNDTTWCTTKLGMMFWLYIWLWNVTLATILTGRTIYCSVIVPTYFTSLALAWTTTSWPSPIWLMVASILLAIAKVNVCMSACLHRYAAHGAMACGPVTRACLLVCGCLANQGGPLWWASHHRCHHKYVCVYEYGDVLALKILLLSNVHWCLSFCP